LEEFKREQRSKAFVPEFSLIKREAMAADSKGRTRPRDPDQLAKLIVGIASGQVEDRDPTTPEERGKHPGAVVRGGRGGAARAENLD
jgi:hypothetical protein